MKTYKLKRKIWIISTVILTVYIACLIANPTIWTALLPVIIPSAILTVGIPGYAITKHIKYTLEKETLKLSNPEKEIGSLQNTKQTEKITTHDIKANVIDNNISQETYTNQLPEKNKVKVLKRPNQ